MPRQRIGQLPDGTEVVHDCNFSNQVAPDTWGVRRYFRCNFTQTDPELRGDGEWHGIRLWPGDDTPRHFVDCNLVNCEIPPGSEVINCNTAIVAVDVHIEEVEDQGKFDGEDEVRTSVCYGRYVNGGIERKPSPEVSQSRHELRDPDDPFWVERDTRHRAAERRSNRPPFAGRIR